MAETAIGLYKIECARTDSAFESRTTDDVAWYNQQSRMHRFGRVPPDQAEAEYYSRHVTDRPAARSQNPEGA